MNSDCYVYFNCLLESNLQKDSSIRRSIRKTTFCRTVMGTVHVFYPLLKELNNRLFGSSLFSRCKTSLVIIASIRKFIGDVSLKIFIKNSFVIYNLSE